MPNTKNPWLSWKTSPGQQWIRVFSIRGSEPGYPNLLESIGYDIHRAMERAIRKTKREIVIKQQEMNEIAETDVRSVLREDYDKLAAKLTQQNKAYNDFCKDNDLQPDYVRAKVADFGRKQQAQVNASVKAYKNAHLQENNVANSLDTDIIRTGSAKEEIRVHSVGKIDRDIYKCITEDIVTDEVIITDERILHIKERHPSDYERFCAYIPAIISEPDFIIRANKPDTATLLKEVVDKGEKFQLVLRLKTSKDKPEFKNSVITFLNINERTWKKYIRNKEILYRRE